jgi:hypothetical protein
VKHGSPLFCRCAIACMGYLRGGERDNFPACRQGAAGRGAIFAAYHGI